LCESISRQAGLGGSAASGVSDSLPSQCLTACFAEISANQKPDAPALDASRATPGSTRRARHAPVSTPELSKSENPDHFLLGPPLIGDRHRPSPWAVVECTGQCTAQLGTGQQWLPVDVCLMKTLRTTERIIATDGKSLKLLRVDPGGVDQRCWRGRAGCWRASWHCSPRPSPQRGRRTAPRRSPARHW